MGRKSGVLVAVAAGAFLAGMFVNPYRAAEAQAMNQVYELRTYTAEEGQLPTLSARFGGGETALFEKHGMTGVGYWVPADEPDSQNTLIYMLAHPSREAAQEAWRNFGSDAEWQSVAEESRRDGRLIVGLESVFLEATDFSPMR